MRLFALIIITLCSFAQAASIWHVSGKSQFYLFGTVHVLKPDAYPLPQIYDQAFSQCDQLWLEVDQAQMSDNAILLEAQQIMRTPNGETLQSQLSEANYNILKTLAGMANADLTYLQHIKPWAVVNSLTVAVMQTHGFDVEKGLDQHLANWAQRDGIPMQGLESLIWQIGMLDYLGTQYADHFFEFSTNELDNVDQLVADLVRHWEQGDVEALYEQAEFDDYPTIEKIMLTDRNDKWMQTLLAQPTNKTHCVAVGALHMAGPNGLLAQFKREGYEVTAIE